MKLLRCIVLVGIFCLVPVVVFLNAGRLLSCVAEAPVAADVIVVLSSPERVAKGEELYRKKFAPRVFLSIPDELRYFGKGGASPENVAVPGWCPQTTYQEALAFAEYLQEHPADAAIIVTDSYHLYRVKWTFEHVFRSAKISFTYVSTQREADPGFWWDDLHSRMFVLTELPKVVYYWLYHGLLGYERDPQWTVDLKNWYARQLLAMLV